MNHLAIYSTKAFGEDYIEMMLNGIKTIDSKFSYRRTAPYMRLQAGDIIYFKESSGPIRGRIRVRSVVNAELTVPEHVMEFLSPHYKELGIKDEDHLMEVWRNHASKRYVCQWVMENPEYIREPVRIFKRDMRNWVPDYDVPEEVVVGFVK